MYKQCMQNKKRNSGTGTSQTGSKERTQGWLLRLRLQGGSLLM